MIALLKNKWFWIGILILILIIVLIVRLKNKGATNNPYDYTGENTTVPSVTTHGSVTPGYAQGASDATGRFIYYLTNPLAMLFD